MKIKILILALIIGCFLGLSSVAFTETFDIDVIIPSANSATFVVWKLFDGQPFPNTPETTTNLSFATTLTNVEVDPTKPPKYAFLGNYFYAIDVFPTGGAGNVNVQIAYSDTSTLTGLGNHGIATVVRVNPANNTEAELRKETLANIPQTITASEIAGTVNGRFRMYVGLATGDAANNEPAGAVPFNPGDTPGTYTGRLTLTVTPA
jgi:hypothetical protein